ncbi:MAG: agmatinase, partial [Deltaproteobacteria bacterium]|nr:agmatinase [Deltaproteobacteria bacterium]
DEELGAETLGEEGCSVNTLAPLEVGALSPEAMVDSVYGVSKDVLKGESIPVLLGGEHSVTLGLVKALIEKHDEVSVLQLDAHADLRESYGGSSLSHACVMRRVAELAPVTQVGIRSLCKEEADFLSSEDASAKKINTFFAKDHLSECGSLTEETIEKISSKLGKKVYITIDTDAFDPSVMPSTGTPEPGGFTWYGVLALLREVCRRKSVVGFDVVELSPIKDMVAPDFMAAKLVYKLMGYIAASKNE